MPFNYTSIVFLLFFNLAFFIAYLVNDMYWDNKLDQPFNYGLLLLILIFGTGFIWHSLARRPHYYVR